MTTNPHLVELLRSPPNLHEASGELTNWGVDAQLMPHMERLVKPGHRTLETGSGLSTIAFIALGADHVAVSPDGGEPERIRAYCADKGIDASRYEHVVQRSEAYLPGLDRDPYLDFVLVDGDHAFPVPCLDWFYAARLLKKGGIMVIDDVQLWSCRIVADFLSGDTAWEQIDRTPRFAVYRLLEDAGVAMGRWWGQQPYVVAQSEDDAPGLVARLKKKLRL